MSDQRPRRVGVAARWAAGLAAATMLVGAGAILGAHLTSGGSTPTVSTRLVGNSAFDNAGAGALTSTFGSQATASAISAVTMGSGTAKSLQSELTGLRECLAAARKLAGEGHRVAARAKRLACIRQYHLGGLLLLRRLFRLGAEYGDITFQTKTGSETVGFERGVVQTAATGSAVVVAPNGTSWTWNLVSNTVIVKVIRKHISAATLAKGQRVFVVGTVVGGADNARLIIIRG
jgi:hypothetical protein